MLVEQGRHLVATFHPELTGDPRIHRLFLEKLGEDERFAKQVLFVCIGNSCRSQMAEGFARTYGSDVMDAGERRDRRRPWGSRRSRVKVMREKNIDLAEAVAQGIARCGDRRTEWIWW